MLHGTATHCPYCALQCGMRVEVRPGQVGVRGDEAFPTNQGQLCVKGFTAAATLLHRERLRTPLIRDRRGALRSASWDEALDRVVAGFRRAQARGGPDAVGVFGSGALTNEKAYLLGKLARVALGTSQIDYNGRFCMSSSAAAAVRALGIDRGLPFPLADLAETELVVLAGANPAETMPPLVRYLDAQRARGGRLLVIDPRRTPTAQRADLHPAPRPGTDVTLVNGLLHLLVRDGRVDARYIAERTSGFERVRAVVASYWPDRVERQTGVPERKLREAAQLLGCARSVIILTGRGPEQQSQGVACTLSYINLPLSLGAVGRPASGWGCLSGQGNGQGGREHGQKADQLPGYRSILDPAAREHVASVWGVPADSLPGPGRSACEMLDTLGEPGGVSALLVMGANLAVSAPDGTRVRARLRALDLLVVTDFFLSETAELADVILPVAQWAEEEGTMTTLEGRVIRRRRAAVPPRGVLTDLEVICALGARLGHAERFRYDGPEAVFAELARASAGGPADYAGITYERIDREQGVYWPCPSASHPGTPRLFAVRFPTPDGRARFHAVEQQPAAEEPDEAHPVLLTTGRVLAHYQSGAQTRRVPRLRAIAPEPKLEIHPRLAARLGVRGGDRVVVKSRRGRAELAVAVTRDIREDTAFAPFHFAGEQSINDATHAALDPVSRMPELKVCAVQIEKSGKPKEEEPG